MHGPKRRRTRMVVIEYASVVLFSHPPKSRHIAVYFSSRQGYKTKNSYENQYLVEIRIPKKFLSVSSSYRQKFLRNPNLNEITRITPVIMSSSLSSWTSSSCLHDQFNSLIPPEGDDTCTWFSVIISFFSLAL